MARRVRIPKSKPVLERHVEKPVVNYARSRGCLARKMNGLGHRGWPDQMFITPDGVVFFIEFKRPGVGELSINQEVVISELRDHNVFVVVVNNVETGVAYVDSMLAVVP